MDHRRINTLERNELLKKVPDCTACAACMNVCPVHAISMPQNKAGFYRPLIDEVVCIGCRKCLKTCPVLNEELRTAAQEQNGERPELPTFYYGWIADAAARDESSSGGLFTALARYVFARGGCVFGVRADAELHPFHAKAENESELAHMRGSKYVQSRVENIYQEVRAELKKGRFVLFTGVPCQIGGLRAFLGYKDYPNLLTVDVVCHGVPSLHLLSAYVGELKQRYQREAAPVSIRYRDKCSGWSRYRYSVTAEWADGTSRSALQQEDAFMRGFISDLFLNEGCYHCRYQGVNGKLSDMTLGDAWHIWDTHPELDDGRGVSSIVVHSAKGAGVLGELPGVESFVWNESEATQGNKAIVRAATRPARADRARRLLGKTQISELVRRYRESPVPLWQQLRSRLAWALKVWKYPDN